MGVVVCRGAGGHKNKTSIGKTGLAGYVRVTCMAGKFPEKTHACAHRHKKLMRDSGGLGWVRMGAGGCIGTQQTQNKANRVISGRAGHIWDNHAWGGNGHKDGVVINWSSQNIWGECCTIEGCPGILHTSINK